MNRFWSMALAAGAVIPGLGLFAPGLHAGEVVVPVAPVSPIYPLDLDYTDTVFWKGAEFGRELQSYYASASVPLAASDSSLLLFEGQFAWNDPLDEQINAGLIHRWTVPGRDFVIGENVFYDYNTSPNGNGFGGVGVGMEALCPNFEFRFNYYWPDSRQPQISQGSSSTRSGSSRRFLGTSTNVRADGPPTSTSTSTSSSQSVNFGQGTLTTTTTTTRTTTRQDFLRTDTSRFENSRFSETRTIGPRSEAAMQGLDVEAGWSPECLPDWMNLWGFVGYYDFQNPYGADSAGFKARAEWRFNRYLCIESLYYENAFPTVGGNWYSGFRVSCPMEGEGLHGMLANLVTPEGDGGKDTRWLQRVFRQRRFRFGESEAQTSTASSSSSSIETRRRFTPFFETSTTANTTTSTIFTPNP